MAAEPTAGLALKAQHWGDAQAVRADGLWFEVHAENYMMEGGPPLHALEAVRRDKPLAIHDAGLSLASDAPPDPAHLKALKRLVDRFEPCQVSEHLAWSRRRRASRPGQLPFPRDLGALERVVDNVARTQDALGRPILVENPPHYVALNGHVLAETEFLGELARRTGCGLLVDVNHVHVSASNLGYDPLDYLDSLPDEAIREIRLSGCAADRHLGAGLMNDGLVDAYAAPVSEAVWDLYGLLLARIGPRPTLLERHGDIPPFVVLMAERDKVETILDEARRSHAGDRP